MIVYLEKSQGLATLRIRPTGDGNIGDATIDVGPGQSAFGRPYDEWMKLPEGPHEVP